MTGPELLTRADLGGALEEPGAAQVRQDGCARLCEELVTERRVLEMRRGVGAEHDDFFERETVNGGTRDRKVDGVAFEASQLFDDGARWAGLARALLKEQLYGA